MQRRRRRRHDHRRRHRRDGSLASLSASSSATTPMSPPYGRHPAAAAKTPPTPFALPPTSAAASSSKHERTLDSVNSVRTSRKRRRNRWIDFEMDESDDVEQIPSSKSEESEESSDSEKYVSRDRKRRRRILQQKLQRQREEEQNESKNARKPKRRTHSLQKSKPTDLSYSPHAHSPLLYSHDEPTYLQMASFIPRHQLHQRPRLPKHLRRKRRGGGPAPDGTSGRADRRSFSPEGAESSHPEHLSGASSHAAPYGYPSRAQRSYNIMPRSMIDPAESLARTRSRRKRKPAKKVVEELVQLFVSFFVCLCKYLMTVSTFESCCIVCSSVPVLPS